MKTSSECHEELLSHSAAGVYAAEYIVGDIFVTVLVFLRILNANGPHPKKGDGVASNGIHEEKEARSGSDGVPAAAGVFQCRIRINFVRLRSQYVQGPDVPARHEVHEHIFVFMSLGLSQIK